MKFGHKMLLTMLAAAGSVSASMAQSSFSSQELINQYKQENSIQQYTVLGMLFLVLLLLVVSYVLYINYRRMLSERSRSGTLPARRVTWMDVFGSSLKTTEEHEVDDIREQDNNPPAWFNWLFYGSITFAFIYLVYFHVLKIGKMPAQEYAEQMKEADKLLAVAQEKAIELAKLPPYTDKDHLEEGRLTFVKNCIACHGPDGQGNIGPNLTDDYWLHGGKYDQIFTTIFNGVPEKGMLSWKKSLKPEEIRVVASFVKSLHGSNPPNPKAPQGEKMADAGSTGNTTSLN